MNQYSKILGVGVGNKFMWKMFAILDHKNRYNMDMNHRWGDLIHYTVNISSLMVELAKINSTGTEFYPVQESGTFTCT